MKNPRISPLSRKLFFSFIISFLAPMTALSIITSYLFGINQYNNISNQAADNAKLIAAYINKYISDIDNITKAPYYHSYFQSNTPVETLSSYKQNQISEDIKKLLQLTTYSRDDFSDLIVMSDDWVIYFNSADWYRYLPTVNPLNKREWYTKALKSNGSITFVPQEGQLGKDGFLRTDNFYISRKLNNMFVPKQNNIIMVNLKTDALKNLFSDLTTSVPIMILFTNDDGKLIYSNTPVTESLVNLLGQKQITQNQNTWNQYEEKLEDYPLTVHVLLSASYINKQITAFIFITLIFYLAGICIAYLLFRRNNKWIEKPTYHIKAVLKELESENLTARCQPLPVQEFHEIGISINTMAAQLQERIRNEYKLSIAQKSLQLQALQSQIQPHFIINTIYSFISLNQIGEQERLNDAFYSFAHLLRYVLNTDNQTTLGKELDFLNDYCSLCLLRFGNRLSFKINCEEEFRELTIPKLLLQPLVENAVIHGIEPSETPCVLEIEIASHSSSIYISITDDGVGFKENGFQSKNSIGIKNVENRMNLWDPNVKFLLYRVEGITYQFLIIPKELIDTDKF